MHLYEFAIFNMPNLSFSLNTFASGTFFIFLPSHLASLMPSGVRTCIFTRWRPFFSQIAKNYQVLY